MPNLSYGHGPEGVKFGRYDTFNPREAKYQNSAVVFFQFGLLLGAMASSASQAESDALRERYQPDDDRPTIESPKYPPELVQAARIIVPRFGKLRSARVELHAQSGTDLDTILGEQPQIVMTNKGLLLAAGIYSENALSAFLAKLNVARLSENLGRIDLEPDKQLSFILG